MYNGHINGGITVIPTGGNSAPINIEGHNDEWKNAQKKPKNNIISEIRNNKKPEVIPICTPIVWSPAQVASSMISSTHEKQDLIKIINAKIIGIWVSNSPWILKVKDDTKKNAPIPTNKGQGLKGKIWNKCRRFIKWLNIFNVIYCLKHH